MLKYLKLFAFFSFIAFFSCNKDNEPEEEQVTADQQALLENYADSLIVPAYTEFLASLKELDSKLESNASNVDLQESLDEAYILWQSASFYDFGPALTYSLHNNINIYPSDTGLIDTNIINNVTNVSASTFADQKGLPGLDYLFYNFDALSTSQNQYAQLIVGDMISKVENTLGVWNDSYRDFFVSNKGYDSGSSVSFLMNAYVRYFESNFRDGKLGLPLGKRSSGVQLEDKTEGFFSGNSSKIFLAGTIALQDAFYGGDGYGLYDLLKTDDSSLSNSNIDRVDELWGDVEKSVSAIDTPLEVFVIDDQATGDEVYADIQTLLVMLKINVLSSLNVKVSYVDGDGD